MGPKDVLRVGHPRKDTWNSWIGQNRCCHDEKSQRLRHEGDLFRPDPPDRLGNEYDIKYVSLNDLLTLADFVSIHVPVTNETQHLIGKHQFNMMKKTAYIINTSRGPVVDEKALYEALKEKKIAGTGLDVFEKEPIDPTNPLINLDNIVMTPHIASASIDTRIAMAMMAAMNVIAVFDGREPPNAVNPEMRARAQKY